MSQKINIFIMSLLLTLSFSTLATNTTESDYDKFKIKSSKKLEQMEVKLEKLKKKSVKLSGETKDKLIDEYAVLKDKIAKYKDDLAESSKNAGSYTAGKWKKFKNKMDDYGNKIESKLDEMLD
jgi:hypothetical protein